VEWSVNEKVAFEVAIGGSLAGLRAMVSMKHAGFNWITDPSQFPFWEVFEGVLSS